MRKFTAIPGKGIFAGSVVANNTKVNYNDIRTLMKAAADVQSQEDLDSVISSLLSIDAGLYKHYSEMIRRGDLSPAYIGKLISDELYQLL